jgi:hypothetical protein
LVVAGFFIYKKHKHAKKKKKDAKGNKQKKQ